MSKQSKSATEGKIIRTRISKIQFPEVCPVCLEQAEDLVFVTITERIDPESYESKTWIKGSDKASATLEAVKGVTTFAVPTCMRHGSKSVRTTRTKMIAFAGFFIFFYPILFFLLQINLALNYSRSLVEPLMGVFIFATAMCISILYGVFPRALERKLKFGSLKRAKDLIEIVIMNDEYRRLFLELNEIYSDIITDSI